MHCRSILLAALLPAAALAGDTPPPPAAATTQPQPATGFVSPGEVLELRMSYGLLGTAGTTRIETLAESSADGPRYRIRVATKSSGLIDTFYTVVNDSESVLDAATGRPLTLTTKGKNGRRLTEKTTTFDYAAGQAIHVNAIRPKHNATVPLPAEPAYDLMVALLQTRGWNLKPGQSRRVHCVNDDEFFTLEVAATGEDHIKTPAGTFDAVVLEPKPVGTPVGFFKKGGALKVWISKGDRPQIVRLDTKLKFGTITAVLTKEETLPPPAAPQPPTGTAAPEQQPSPAPSPEPARSAPAASAP
jgi:hypothetical protein